MSSPIYRWTLQIDFVPYEAQPRWEGTLVVEDTQEQGQVFSRRRIAGPLTFQRADYDYIAAASIEDKIELILEEFTGTWEAVVLSYFYKTDCDIDEDNKTVIIQPSPNDKYDPIMKAMDREFDIVKMSIPTTPVNFKKHPVFQIYARGASRLTNVVGETYSDQDVLAPVYDPYVIENTYFFGSPGWVMFIPGDAMVLNPDVSGRYVYNGSGNNYLREDGAYEIRLRPSISLPDIQWEIVAKPSNTVVYEKPLNEGLINPEAFAPHPVPFNSMTTSDECQVYQQAFYLRVLTDNSTYGGADNHAIPAADIVAENPNYERVIAIDLSDSVLLGSSGHQVDPFIYGKFVSTALHFAGDYFTRPTPSPAVGTLFPILRYLWQEYSAWFFYDATLLDLQEDTGEDVTIIDCYKLPDILSAILGEIAPTISHDEVSAYSDFYYGPANSIRDGVKYPIFTPKSNVTIGNYDHPASRAPLKLGELLTFLAQYAQVYWYIDDNNRLCLEHIDFFERGKTYGAPNIGVDLTALLEPRTGLPWGYRSNRYKYDKLQMPEQIRWNWMDEVSAGFKGYPIEMRSAYVRKGQFDDRPMAMFTSDVDFVVSQPASISQEGFMFFEAVESGGVYSLPFVAFAVSDIETYFMQNGYASLVWLHDHYHRHWLPARLVNINGLDVEAASVRRSKVQEVEYPSGIDPDPMLLITTGLGTGKVRQMTINLSSRANKMIVLHDTE